MLLEDPAPLRLLYLNNHPLWHRNCQAAHLYHIAETERLLERDTYIQSSTKQDKHKKHVGAGGEGGQRKTVSEHSMEASLTGLGGGGTGNGVRARSAKPDAIISGPLLGAYESE